MSLSSDPAQQPGPPPSIVFDAFTGLKNTVTQERLTKDELFRAVNVDLDDKGKLSRRRGFTKVVSGNFHSLFNCDDRPTVLGVKNGSLGIVNPDYSFIALQSNIGGDYTAGQSTIAYVQVGDFVYFSCTAGNGVVNLVTRSVGAWGSSQPLILSPVVNPNPELPAIAIKILTAPPVSTAMTYFNGRIYMAVGRTLWWTELFLYNYVDATKTFASFEGDITMVGTVGDGIYVGTTEGLWFLSPKQVKFGEPPQMGRVRVMDSPVIPGSMVYIPAELANPPQVGTQADTPMQVSISFLTSNGFCVALDGGQAYNLTEGKFFFPSAVRSTALFRRQDGVNQYIAVNDSEGTPASGARIGDYVDATIIRGGGLWPVTTENIAISDVLTPTWS